MLQQKKLRIGQLAKLTGVSVRSLRHYEQRGLLAATRSESGYRYFDARSVEYVEQITAFLHDGFVLEEIKAVASMFERDDQDSCHRGAKIIHLYHSKLAELDARIAALQRIRDRASDRLQHMIQQHHGAVDFGSDLSAAEMNRIDQAPVKAH